MKETLSGHNDQNISGKYTSSSYIRELLNKGKNIRPYIPFQTYDILNDCYKQGKLIPSMKVFEKQLIYALRRMSCEEIENLAEVSEGLENKIKSASNECNTYNELIEAIKSKRYTETRLQRILLYALLGITKQKMASLYKPIPYVRVLGMSQRGKKLLSLAKQANPKLQLVTSVKDFIDTNKSKALREMMELDINSTNIYTQGFTNEPYANLDFTKKIIII